jgi:putative ABC transport system permease protein
MNWVTQLVARRKQQRDLADEMRQHLAERVDALVEDGLPIREAEDAARREFGNVVLIAEQGREVWRWAWIEDLSSDVQYAVRQLRRAPAFTLTIVLTLALGIGANATVFSVVNTVLLRPLPFPEADRLVSVRSIDARDPGHLTTLSYPTFFDFRRDNRVFEQIASYRDDQLTLTGRGLPVLLSGQIVSWDLFPLLGVQLALGRGFLPSDEKTGQRAVVLSHGLWTSRFGADPAVVGTAATLDSQPYTVVGVAPAGFNFPIRNRHVQIWATLGRETAFNTVTPLTEQRGSRLLNCIARLRPRESLASAQAQLDGVAAALARTHPGENGNINRTNLQPELERLVGDTRTPMLILFGAVGLVLLIACANIATVLLARTADRAQEFRIRLAIGGSRARIIRQLLTENLLLSLLGSGAGVAIAASVIQLGLPLAADYIPRTVEVGIDGPVLAFAVSLALLTAVLCTLSPALRMARADPRASLREEPRGRTDVHDGLRGRLVVAQIAIGLMLSNGASLLVVDFARVMTKDLGFRPDHVVTFNISLPDARYPTDARIDFTGRLLERLKELPAVTSAAAAMPLPLTGNPMNISFNIEERPSSASGRPSSDMAIVTPDYFQTIGTPLVEGRGFTERDDDVSPPVIIVNQAFAERFFPGVRAVGKRIEPGATSRRGSMMREIVGVVGNARQAALGPTPEPIYYFPFKQMPWGPPSIVIRTSVPPLTLESSFRQVASSLDEDVPLDQIETLDDTFASQVAGPRLQVMLMGSFALIALLLTAAGLYGLLSYAVQRRTREIGVRIALGASGGTVVRMVLRRAAALVLTAVPVGLAGAFATGRLLNNLISEPGPGSLLPLMLPCALVAITAGIAAYLPARRAASIDPASALRAD